MPISVKCPGCKKKLTGKDELAGKRLKCPGCGHAVLIPAAQPAPQPKATKPSPGKLPVANKAAAITAPPPKKPPAAEIADVVAAPSPASLARQNRWPWYAGGGAVAGCLLVGLVFLLMPGKDRNAAGDERPVLPDSSPAVAQPNRGAGEIDTQDLPREGPGDPALTYDVVNADSAKHHGKRVTWAFTPLSTEDEKMLCALNIQEGMGPRHSGLYVVKFASVKEAGEVFVDSSFKPGLLITGTIAGRIDQFLVVRDRDRVPQKDIPKVSVPLLLYPSHKIGESDAGKGRSEKKVQQGGITKEKLLGDWEGTLKDGTILALKFTDKLVVVSILAPGTNREKAREAAEWASGNLGRGVGSIIGSTEYKIDDAKNEVKIWGTQGWDGIANPTKDEALLVSGDLKMGTVPETRLERVKPEPPAASQPKASLPTPKGEPKKSLLPPMMAGSVPKKSQTAPAKSKESEAATDEIWPKRARAQYFEKPADLWAVFLTDSDKLPKGGPRTPWTRVLPMATKKLIVGVVFHREPPAATVSVRVFTKSGELKLAETKQDFLMINSTYIRYLDLVPENGPFPDDDYRAEVSINGKKVALLKWVIGRGNRDASKPLTEREKLLVGRWRDAKNGAELGAGRYWGEMKFSEDRNLIITVKDTKTNKPAFLWATYKLLEDGNLEISFEGTSHDNFDIPRWGSSDMAQALLREKPYTMKASFSASPKELMFAGVSYERVESRKAGPP